MRRIFAALAIATMAALAGCSGTVSGPGGDYSFACTGPTGAPATPTPGSAACSWAPSTPSPAPTTPSPSPSTPAPTTPPPTTAPPTPGWPDYASTGAPVETGLPAGPCTLAANTTYNAMVFNCATLNMGAGSKVTNSVINGYVRTGYGYTCPGGVCPAPFTIEDSTISRSSCEGSEPAVAYYRYTLRRVHIRGFNDGARAEGPNVKVFDSLIENCFAPDGHADGLQVCPVSAGCGNSDDVTGLEFRHNTVMHPKRDSTGAVFVMGGATGAYAITDNLMMGYTITVRLHARGTFTGNRVVQNGAVYEEADFDDVCTGNGGSPLSGMTMSDNRLVVMVGPAPPSGEGDLAYAPGYDVDHEVSGSAGALVC